MVNIKGFTPRLYQETILNTCSKCNCLIVLPTGLGKTKTAIMIAVQRLNLFPSSSILFLTVTKPLADQIYNEIKKCTDLEENQIKLFTGAIPPEKREELWKDAKIIISTPQCIENDLINNKINLEKVSLLIIDEAHNAVRDYSYTWIAKQYNKRANFPRIIGLTASPGTDLEKIQEVCKNLYIEEIEVRTDSDPDVQPYIQEVKMNIINVDLPQPFIDIQNYFKTFLNERLQKLNQLGIANKSDLKYLNKKLLLGLQAQLHGRIASGEKDFAIWNGISLLAEIMKMQHGLELLETQSTFALYNYLEKLQRESPTTKVKAIKNIAKDLNFRCALIRTQRLLEAGVEHPKLIKLQELVETEIKDNKDVKILIFTQYRDNAVNIEERISQIQGIKAKIFVGQAKKSGTGLSQKEQIEILNKFRENEYNVLIATSIAEQGLDIPQVDLVVFYEPIPSAIRTIQRRGRTGRLEKGRVVMLLTKKTRDEAYRWSSQSKEKRMYRVLESLRGRLKLTPDNKPDLNKFIDKNIKIFADTREKGTGIIKKLVDMGVQMNLQQLDIGDYVLSSKVVVEVKTKPDFVDSIVDGRLLSQLKSLKENYERPLIILQGTEDLYSQRKVHPNAIQGMLATIAVSYSIPIIYTKCSEETASILAIIAKREQENAPKEFSLHQAKPQTLKEQQEYVVGSLPGIGPALAKPLLTRFKTIKQIINASRERLEKVERIGPKKAEEIKQVVESLYT